MRGGWALAECPVCPAPGQVCDEVTGECVCPPNTEGELCENCAPDTWDHHPLKGCKACECDGEGANGTSCDLYDGQCPCRKGYEGRACDSCTFGHYEFPTCRQCKCSLSGTEAGSCRGGVCGCEDSGACPCKANVEGKLCRSCKPDSFSLLKDSPLGCVQCFCFGKSEFCVQATYVWQQIFADDRLALFMEPWAYYEEIRGLRVFPMEPATVHSYPTDNTPLYWALPPSFAGDRVTSYNGFLRFRFPSFPLLSLLLVPSRPAFAQGDEPGRELHRRRRPPRRQPLLQPPPRRPRRQSPHRPPALPQGPAPGEPPLQDSPPGG